MRTNAEADWRQSAQSEMCRWIDQDVPKLWVDRLWAELNAQKPDKEAQICAVSDCSIPKLMTSQTTGQILSPPVYPEAVPATDGSVSEEDNAPEGNESGECDNLKYLKRYPEGTVVWNGARQTWYRHSHNDWHHCKSKKGVRIMRCMVCDEHWKLDSGEWSAGHGHKILVSTNNRAVFGKIGVYNVRRHSNRFLNKISCHEATYSGVTPSVNGGMDRSEAICSPRGTAPTFRCDICNKTMNGATQYQEHLQSNNHARLLIRHQYRPPWNAAVPDLRIQREDSSEVMDNTENLKFLREFPEGTVLWNGKKILRHPHNDWCECRTKKGKKILRCWECKEITALQFGRSPTDPTFWWKTRNVVDEYIQPIYGKLGVYNVGRDHKRSTKCYPNC